MSDVLILVVANERYVGDWANQALHRSGQAGGATDADLSSLAEDLAHALCGDRDEVATQLNHDLTSQDAREILTEWSEDSQRPGSTIIYWTGHGYTDTKRHWLIGHEGSKPAKAMTDLPTADLCDFLVTDWRRRKKNDTDWLVVILDCCGSDVGVRNLVNELTSNDAQMHPRRYAVFGTSAQGAAFAGRTLPPLQRFLSTLNEQDVNTEQISVRDLLEYLDDQLDGVLHVSSLRNAHIPNPLYWGGTAAVSLDQLPELRSALDAMSEDTRAHFFAKAQGTEVGEIAWFFTGRGDETATMCTWLASEAPGLRVVTGPAGVGKSAFLGLLVTLADHELAAQLRAAGWLDDLAHGPLPPDGAFDAVIHLRGLGAVDVERRLRNQLSGLLGDSTTGQDYRTSSHGSDPRAKS